MKPLNVPIAVECARVSESRDSTVELYGLQFEDFVWLDAPEVVVSEKLLTLLNSRSYRICPEGGSRREP